MKRIQASLMSLVALALLGTVAVDTASAGVRVRATLRTPTLIVRTGNVHVGHDAYYRIEPATITVHRRGRLTVHDRHIARRLSGYTGVPARRMMKMRRQGYTWFGVGRFLQLPRPVVRAALHQRSWNRFLRYEARVAGCRIEPHRRNIMHVEEYDFDDFETDGRRFKMYQQD